MAISVVLGTFLPAKSAKAEDTTGFVFSGSLGVGPSAGTYRLTSERIDSAGRKLRAVGRGHLTGTAIRASGFAGYAITPKFALGLGVDLTVVPGLDERIVPAQPQSWGSGSSTVQGVMMPSASIVAAFRPEASAFQARIAAGWAAAGFISMYSEPLGIGSRSPATIESVAGPIGSLSFGYSPSSFGVALTTSMASLKSERATYRPVTWTVEATLSSF